MNEIIQRLIAKTGLSEDQATTAVQVVAGFIKEKLPAPVAAQVDSILGGAGAGAGSDTVGALGSAVGGMFNKG